MTNFHNNCHFAGNCTHFDYKLHIRVVNFVYIFLYINIYYRKCVTLRTIIFYALAKACDLLWFLKKNVPQHIGTIIII